MILREALRLFPAIHTAMPIMFLHRGPLFSREVIDGRIGFSGTTRLIMRRMSFWVAGSPFFDIGFACLFMVFVVKMILRF